MGINVLSLFDGMSCGRIALERAGIDVDTYYSSEIDPHVIKVANKNYPQDAKNRLGDVRFISDEKIKELNIELLIGGSPCQDFSFCGKQRGMKTESNIEITNIDYYLKLKKDGFEFKGQSYLFWEYIRILKLINPKYFLLENVTMDKKWEDVITKTLGFNPIEINSSLVSAQNRKRLYWVNIPNITQPKDRYLKLKDVLQEKTTEKIYKEPYYVPVENKSFIGYVGNKPAQATKVYDINKKSRCLLANGGGQGGKTGLYNTKEGVRKLTAIECERLQNVPDDYTEGVSNAQRLKMLGNGWTVDVIAHILSFLPSEYKK